jgi:hypothetical protein
MKIGIIGSGDVAQSLGKGFLELGHQVMLGTRDQTKRELAAWRKKDSKTAFLGNTSQAAAFGELIVLAVAWHAAEDVLTQIRPEVAGKIVIDVTNPLVFHDDEPPTLAVGHTMSGGEIVQQSLPDSHIVKTLNTISHTNMVKPEFKEGLPIMFACGNNLSAKQHVRDLLVELGWEDVIDIGGIEKSQLLEPLCLLWIEYGVKRDTWNHAIAVLLK